MNNKTYTLALVQAIASSTYAISLGLQGPGDVVPEPTGDMSGFLHVTGVTHNAAGGDPHLEMVDDIYHVDGFYRTLAEAEAALNGGGDHGGNDHQCPNFE